MDKTQVEAVQRIMEELEDISEELAEAKAQIGVYQKQMKELGYETEDELLEGIETMTTERQELEKAFREKAEMFMKHYKNYECSDD